MHCEEIHEKVVLAAYNELTDDQALTLMQHLANCPPCRQEQEQLLALKTLAGAYRVQEPSPNLVARSRARFEESLDALPPKRWYDRVADWMTRTATGLQAAPAAACLLLVAGAGLGSVGGYEFAARRAGGLLVANPAVAASSQADEPSVKSSPADRTATNAAVSAAAEEIASVSGIVRQPNSNFVQVRYSQMVPRQVQGTLDDPKIRQLLMLASQSGTNPDLRNDSVALLAAECRSRRGCSGSGLQGAGVRDALMVALRYDRSAPVRQKALEGLQPFVAEDLQVRDAVLESLLNDPDARIRAAAIDMLEPVEADTSVRQVLSTVAVSDENSHIRNASRVVLRRVSEVQ